MDVYKTNDYLKMVARLEYKEKRILEKQEVFLAENIFHPQLHTKKLKGVEDGAVFSFRITQSYRGLFYIKKSAIILFAIGHRKDVYRVLK